MLSGKTTNMNIPIALATDTVSAYDINTVANFLDTNLKTLTENDTSLLNQLQSQLAQIQSNATTLSNSNIAIADNTSSIESIKASLEEIKTNITAIKKNQIQVGVNEARWEMTNGRANYLDLSFNYPSNYEMVGRIIQVTDTSSSANFNQYSLFYQGSTLNTLRLICNVECTGTFRLNISVYTFYKEK